MPRLPKEVAATILVKETDSNSVPCEKKMMAGIAKIKFRQNIIPKYFKNWK